MRVPTVLAFDGAGNLRGFFLEMPRSVRAEMELLRRGERSLVLTQYRRGFRNEAIERENLDFLGASSDSVRK